MGFSITLPVVQWTLLLLIFASSKVSHSRTMPPTKGGKRPPKGGKGSGKGKKVPSGKVPLKSGSAHSGGKRRAKTTAGKRLKGRKDWAHFIHKVLKGAQKPHAKKTTISARAMTIMGSFVEDMYDRVQTEAVNVAKISKRKTLTAREVQTSARLNLPGELAKHAMSEGTKAVAKYNNARMALRQAKGF